VALLVLHRRVHGLAQPLNSSRTSCSCICLPPWSLAGADATMGRRADVALWIAVGTGRSGRRRRRWSSRSWGRWRSATDAGLVRVPGAKERALLADLLVHAGRVVPADRLVEDLWGEAPPGNPANTLQGRCRPCAGPWARPGRLLVTRPPGYRAGGRPRAGGRRPVRGLVAAAQAGGRRPRRRRPAGGGAGVVAGPALAEFADQPWAQARRPGWRSCAWRDRGAGGAAAGRRWARRVWGSWRAWWPPIRPGAAAGPADGRPCTGPGGRPTPSTCTRRPAGAGRGAGDRPVAGAAAAVPPDPGPGPGPGRGEGSGGGPPAQPARAAHQPGRAGGGAA
jgi:hypothetical protein